MDQQFLLDDFNVTEQDILEYKNTNRDLLGINQKIISTFIHSIYFCMEISNGK